MSWLFASGGQSIRALDSASASVVPMNQSASSVAQSCLTLCDPMDYIVHAILQASILEWVAFPFPGDLPDPGIEPSSLASPALAGRFFTITTTWEALLMAIAGI